MEHDNDIDSVDIDELTFIPVTITLTLPQRKAWGLIFMLMKNPEIRENVFKGMPEIEECVDAVAHWLPDFARYNTDTITMTLEHKHVTNLLAMNIGLLGHYKDLGIENIADSDTDLTSENFKAGLMAIEDGLKEAGYDVDDEDGPAYVDKDHPVYEAVLKAKAARV